MVCGNGSVEVSAWVGVSRHCKISYRVYPGDDAIELTLGGRVELVMATDEAGLRHCVAEFTRALDAFEAAALRPDETKDDLSPSVESSTDRAE